MMEFIQFILHFEQHLREFILTYHAWIYALLFLIIFAETGLVVTPFLPGDSLLFAVGALAAEQLLDPTIVFGLLALAAILGDTVNYWVGRWIGPRVFHADTGRWLNRQHLQRAHDFYEKYGGKAIILARFVPIIRTFAPFVAGIGTMNYSRFISYNVIGGVVWIGFFIWGGYYLGNLPIIKENFKIMLILIILLSITPILYEWWQAKKTQALSASSSVP